MVITFLVHPDYATSARMLDRVRLPNQRREARQILNHVQRLKAMGRALDLPLPHDPYLWYSWIREVIIKYKTRAPQQLFYVNEEWIWALEGSILLGPQDLDIQLGFIYHPAVLMWLGFEDSLKEYLNAHIQASIDRGIKNNMIMYPVLDYHPIQPPWTYDWSFMHRHRSILINKELDRHEPPWYQLNPEFTVIAPQLKYYWPYTPKLGTSAMNRGEADIEHRYGNQKSKLKIYLKSNIPKMLHGPHGKRLQVFIRTTKILNSPNDLKT